MKYNEGDEVYYWYDELEVLIKTKIHTYATHGLYMLEDKTVERIVPEDELFTDKEECLNRVLHYNTATINSYKEEIRKLIRTNERIKGLFDKKDDIEKLYSVQFTYVPKDDKRFEARMYGEVCWRAKSIAEVKQKLIEYGEKEDIFILTNPTITEY